MNEKLLDKEKEVLIERERREQSDKARKALVHVAVMNKKDLEERDSMIARLQDQIEGTLFFHSPTGNTHNIDRFQNASETWM